MFIPRALKVMRERKQHRDGPYGFMFEPYKGDEVVSLDCETTSLDVKEAEVLSVGAVKIRGSRVLTSDRLDIKLKPPKSLTGDSIIIHKIRAMDLTDGIEMDEALEQVVQFIGNRPMLGYYVNFDRQLIDKYLRAKHGFGLPNKMIELSHVYHDIMKRQSLGGDVDLRFDTIANKLKLPILQRHTALGDAITVALMYVRLRYGKTPAA